MTSYKQKSCPYFTWGCADDLTCRLKKTLYCSDDHDCYQSSSAALTDVAVSMFTEASPSVRRKLKCEYASSIARQLSLTPCALMLGILYAERLRQSKSSYHDRVSSSDLYVVSLLVASKFLHDEGEEEEIFNEEWAECAGLSLRTVNRLEKEFLDALDWKVYATPDEFLDVCTRMETKIALKYGLRRGWFSYTDLTQFLLASNYPKVLSAVAESVLRIIGGCALVYGMSLSILAYSMMLVATNTATTRNTGKPSVVSKPCNTSSSYPSGSESGITPDCTLTQPREQVLNNMSQEFQLRDHFDNNEEMSLYTRSGNNKAYQVNNGLFGSKVGEIGSNIGYHETLKKPRLQDSSLHRKSKDSSCYCHQAEQLCFEPYFGFTSHHTELDYGMKQDKLREKCNDMFFNPSTTCNCLKGNKLPPTQHPLEVALLRKYTRNVMFYPSLLGIAVK